MMTTKIILSVLMLFAVIQGKTQTGTEMQESYPLIPQNYNLDLSFDFEEEIMNGMCEITMVNNSKQMVNSISLLLYRLLKVQQITNSEGIDIHYSQQVTEMVDFGKLQVNHINIGQDIQPGEKVTVKLRYSGYLLGYTETGMRYITDCISPEFTLIRFDAYAYPIVCTPSIAAIRKSVEVKYDYSLNVTVPDSLTVANGGILQDKVSDKGLTVYKYVNKLPAWRIDIAVAPYKQLKSETMRIYYFKEEEEAAKAFDERGERCMQLYKNIWGELQSNKGLTLIETAKGSGGQTDETTILMPSESFNSSDVYYYLYHELSHLWNVSIKEPQGLSPRWEEGLATFCQFYACEKLGDKPAGYLKERTNTYIRRLNERISHNPELAKVPLIDYGNNSMTDMSYSQ